MRHANSLRAHSLLVSTVCTLLLTAGSFAPAVAQVTNADTVGIVHESIDVDESEAAALFATAEAAIYFPAAKRVRWLEMTRLEPAALSHTPAVALKSVREFREELEIEFPAFRLNTYGAYVMKLPSVALPLPQAGDAAVHDTAIAPNANGVVFSETFESGLSQWKLGDDSGGKYDFVAGGCAAHGGNWAADAVRGGTAGQYMFCWDPYPKSVVTQMAHTTCESIQGASQAWLDFYFTADMDANDSIGVYYLAADGYLYGYTFLGTWTNWYHIVLNLKQWNGFGDLTAQSCPKVYFQFNSAATNTTHAGTQIDDITIRTDAPAFLKAGINANPTSGAAPLTVVFSPSVSGSAGGETYQWSFGDAANSSAATSSTTFTYAAPGTYWARLRVTDSSGIRSYAHVKITATTAGSCSLSCSATVPATAAAGSAVAFASTASATSCSSSPSYSWNFGDGQTSTSQNPSHTYATAGSYVWSLTVTAGGVTCAKSGTIVVSAPVRSRLRAVIPPAPVTLASGTIGSTGGSLSGGGLTITVAAGALASNATVGLKKVPGARGEGVVSDTYAITGLPAKLSGSLTIEIDVSGSSLGADEKYFIAADAAVYVKSLPYEQADTVMMVPVEAALSGTKARITIPASWNMPKAAATAPSIESTGAMPHAYNGEFRVKAEKVATYQTDHFYSRVVPSRASEANSILNMLESHYQKLIALGFSFDCRVDSSTKQFRRIYVEPAALGTLDSSPLGYHVSGGDPCGTNWLFSSDYLQITTSFSASDTRVRAAAAHELFHLVQDIYSPGGARANLWLKEASSTWLETTFGLCPDVQSAYQMFPFNGLFNSKSSSVSAFWSSDKQTRHGYGASYVLKSRTDASGNANDPFVGAIWTNIKAGSSEVSAFQSALGSTNLGAYWTSFARDYFEGRSAGTCFPNWASFDRESVTTASALPRTTSIEAYPLSAKPWNVDLQKFTSSTAVPSTLTATGLIANQSVYVYDVKTKSELAQLTQTSPQYAISDLVARAGSVLVSVFVDSNVPSGDANSQSPTNNVALKLDKLNVTVTVSPVTASVAPGGTQTFTATVTGSPDTAVTWSVQEGSSGGTISGGGTYTAPATPGTYHVVATSQADPSKSATATVNVGSGGADVTISPSSVTLPVFGTQKFVGMVGGVPVSDFHLKWSILEGSKGGNLVCCDVNDAATYSAPATVGTYHVVATSIKDPTKSATATVTTKSPPFDGASVKFYTPNASWVNPPPGTGYLEIRIGNTNSSQCTYAGTTLTCKWDYVVSGPYPDHIVGNLSVALTPTIDAVASVTGSNTVYNYEGKLKLQQNLSAANIPYSFSTYPMVYIVNGTGACSLVTNAALVDGSSTMTSYTCASGSYIRVEMYQPLH